MTKQSKTTIDINNMKKALAVVLWCIL